MSQPTPQVVTIPRPPGPPFEPTSLLLDHATGWRFAEETGLFETSHCELVLQESPGSMRLLTEPSGSFGGLKAPGNVACAADGAIYLLDEARHLLKRFDPCACAFATVGCVTRCGGGARELRGRGGIAIGCGALYICDGGIDGKTGTGTNPGWNVLRRRLRAENHRVSVFDLDGFGLRGHLRPPASEFADWKPTAVAVDRRSGVWVTDLRNNCVQLFSLAGRWKQAIVGFNAPIEIACDRSGDFYVLDADPATGKPRAQVLHADGSFGALPASVGAAGRSFARLPFRVLPDGTLDMRECCTNPSTSGYFAPDGTPLAAAPKVPPRMYLTSGVYRTDPLDSRILSCQWHRVALCGALPAGTSMTVETFAADQVYTDDQLAGFATWSAVQARAQPASAAKSVPGPWRWDALVRSPPGRYLWLRITLRGSGKATPALRSVIVEFPRITSMQYLPAVFGAEPTSADFSQRFIALYDHVMRSIECKVDTLACWFDPLSTPGRPVGDAPIDFLTWLASWIGLSLDRSWSEQKRRWLVKNAARLYPLRGTFKGLRGMLLLLLGWDQPQPRWARPATSTTNPSCAPRIANCRPALPCVPYQPPPLILEHFRLRRWLRLGAGRLGLEATLWGQRIVDRSQLNVNARIGKTLILTTPDPADDPVLVHANRFTVFVPARFRAAAPKRSLENLLRNESAAYLAYDVEYVEPRMRIGVQSMIGFDAVIARLPEGVVLGRSPLGRATILSAPAGTGPGPRLGRTSRLGSGATPMH